MMSSRPPCPLTCPTQGELDRLVQAGVSILALARPEPVMVARGTIAHDGLFEPHPHGDRWFAVAVPEADDIVFWLMESGAIATWSRRAFALGEMTTHQAMTYAFDNALNIFADPLEWLQAGRDGIVVLPGRWPLAFDRLRDAPRIAVAEEILHLYRKHMKPARMPKLLVIPARKRAA
jgi:hypothetical protein